MRLPPVGSEAAHRKYRDLSRDLEVSRTDRKARAQGQRSAYLTGTDSGQKALYNKLKEFVRWSSANLHAPDGIRWGCHVPREYGDQFIEQQEVVADHFATYYRDSGAALTYDLGVKYAHVYDGVVFKTIANGNAPQLWLLPDPSDLGVLEENQPSLEGQEALCHRYDLNLPAFDRLLERSLMPERQRADLQEKAAATAAPPRDTANVMPPAVSRILLSGASPSPLSGAIPGFPMVLTNLARVNEPCAAMAEVWVKDDEARAYRRVTLHTPTLTVIDDPIMKPTYGPHHCFHLLSLDEVPGYLWGISPLDDLIGLQIWRERRMTQLDAHEEIRLNPPLLFLGVSGIDDEVAKRFRTPGGNAYSTLPNADVKPIVPQQLADPMMLVNAVDQMFDRQSGMRRQGAAEGSPGARSGEQEMALAALGSPQHRNIAMKVESVESEVATLMFRIMANTDDDPLVTVEGEKFLMATIADAEAVMRVSGHSASPYYEQQVIQRATLAHKEGALDDDEWIEFLGLPRTDVLRVKARRRMKAKAEQAGEVLEMKKTEAKAKVLKATK